MGREEWDREELGESFEQDEWAAEDIEETLKAALPNPFVSVILLLVVAVPIVLALWLGMRATFLAIAAAAVFAGLLLYGLYRSIRQKRKWNQVKDFVLPEMERGTAVHFHSIQASVTDHYVVIWGINNLHVFSVDEVEKFDGKVGMRNYRGHQYNDLLVLKRVGKKPVMVGNHVELSEMEQANQLISQRKLRMG